MEPLEIKFDRKILMIGLTLFVLICPVFLWSFVVFEKTWTQLLVTTFGAIVFPVYIRFYLTRLIEGKPAIVISEKGIWDNSTFLPVGWIAWTDVEEIHINHTLKALSISVKESFEFIAKIPNRLKRGLIKMNWKFTKGNRINLNHKLTKMSYLNLLKEVENYQKKNRFFDDLSEHLVGENG